MVDDFENKMQIKAVHIILSDLLKRDVLSDNPSNVEMTRDDYPSVFPCRWGGPKLDISQIDWAFREGKWWFNGPIKKLKIKVPKKKKDSITENQIDSLKRVAKMAKFGLSISFVRTRMR